MRLLETMVASVQIWEMLLHVVRLKDRVKMLSCYGWMSRCNPSLVSSIRAGWRRVKGSLGPLDRRSALARTNSR